MWFLIGRLFRELLLQERRGLLCNGVLQRLWEGCFWPAGEETKEIAVKHRVTPVLHTLKKFYSDLTQESMEELLPGGFTCRSCVSVIERYNSVHQEVLSNMKEVLRIARSELQSEQVDSEVPCQQPYHSLSLAMSPPSTPYGATQDTDAVSPTLTVNISK